MDNQKQSYKNTIIMIAPGILPVITFLIIFGESFLIFLIPLMIFILATLSLAKKLNTRDAVAFPFVQYPFLLLLLYLFYTSPPGLGFLLILPITFTVNTVIGHLYFRYIKYKNLFTDIIVFLLTLFITIVLYT